MVHKAFRYIGGIMLALFVVIWVNLAFLSGDTYEKRYMKTHEIYETASGVREALGSAIRFPRIDDKETDNFYAVLEFEDGSKSDSSKWVDFHCSYTDQIAKGQYYIIVWFNRENVEAIPENTDSRTVLYQETPVTIYEIQGSYNRYAYRAQFEEEGKTYQITASSDVEPEVLSLILGDLLFH